MCNIQPVDDKSCLSMTHEQHIFLKIYVSLCSGCEVHEVTVPQAFPNTT